MAKIEKYLCDTPQLSNIRTAVWVVENNTPVLKRFSKTYGKGLSRRAAIKLVRAERDKFLASPERALWENHFKPTLMGHVYSDPELATKEKLLPFRYFCLLHRNGGVVVAVRRDNVIRSRSIAKHGVDHAVNELVVERFINMEMPLLDDKQVKLLVKAVNAQLAYCRKYGIFDATLGQHYSKKYSSIIKGQ